MSQDDPHIYNAVQIGGILKRLHDEHSLLTVSFPGRNEIFNSAVLGVHLDQGCVTLDELNPRRGHELVTPGCTLRVEARVQGAETRFMSTVREIALEDGIFLYKLDLPAQLYHHQRRQHHRVPVRLTQQASVAFEDDRTIIKGRLSDLSVGGLGGVVSDGTLLEGKVYTCTIHLPGIEPISVSVEIRFAGTADRGGQQRFGGRFLQVNPGDRRRLERTVMELERELRRNT